MKDPDNPNATATNDNIMFSRPPSHPDPSSNNPQPDPEDSSNPTTTRNSTSSFTACSSSYYDSSFVSNQGDLSPCNMSPWHHSAASPYASSPWNQTGPNIYDTGSGSEPLPPTCLIGSLVREEGHIYSLAAKGDLLYTGSDSKNIRVWKNQEDFCGFKSSSGLVKSIIIAGDKIFSGHQDGKIRVWKVMPKDPKVHKRVSSLPRLKDIIRCSLKPSNYVEGRRKKSGLWLRHYDAISCLSYNEEQGLLYSGSWDKTFKVWRVSDSKCLESITAHDDAVNSVVAPSGFDGATVFTGSADGTVKVWKREVHSKGTKHVASQTLLKQESAVTALVVSPGASVLYSGSSDGLINLWEWDGKGLLHGEALKGHKLAVLCLVAAGSLLFSGSADKTICVWRRDGAVHTCLSVLTGHGGPVKCLAVEEEKAEDDQRYVLYSGSLDKSVKVWRVSNQAPDTLLQSPRPSMFGYTE